MRSSGTRPILKHPIFSIEYLNVDIIGLESAGMARKADDCSKCRLPFRDTSTAPQFIGGVPFSRLVLM